MWTIFIFYVVIFIIELLYIHFVLGQWDKIHETKIDKDIKFNLENSDRVAEFLKQKIDERLEMLKTMDYYDWIAYNNKNVFLDFEGHKYFIYVWERAKIDDKSNRQDTSTFIVRGTPFDQYRNISFENVVSQINYHFLYGVYRPDENIPNIMWDLCSSYGEEFHNLNIYWINTENNKPVEKYSLFKEYTKTPDNFTHGKNFAHENKIEFEGIIGSGYEVRNLALDYSDTYYHFLGFWFFFGISLFSLMISLVIYYSTDKRKDLAKPLLFLIFTNAYLMHFLSYEAGLTSLESEQSKSADINAGITAISFLVAVNIFIVQTLRGEKKSQYGFLHNESAFLFCISLIFLLISAAKKTNFNEINELRVHNISSQFFFNMSIIINLIVFLNYLLFVASNSRFFKVLKIFN